MALARLLGYGPAATREIINVSATLGVAASRRALTSGATVRNVYTGLSGSMGWLAHTLVQSGFTGEPDAVGSVYGAIYADRFDPEVAVVGSARSSCYRAGSSRSTPAGATSTGRSIASRP